MEMNDRPTDAHVSIRERVKSPPAKPLVDAYFAPSVAAGMRYQFEPEMQIHLAHAVMLERQGIVKRDDIARILRTVLDLRKAGPSSLAIDYKQEDLYSYVESHIVKTLGPEVGGRLHTARSRNDMHTTSWRLALRTRLLALLNTLAALRATTLDQAELHAKTVMPGYTHTQHAQPVSYGYYLLTAAEVFERDSTRLLGALKHCDCCPLGSGALTTTGFPIDRALVAELLGFGAVLEIAYDGVSCRDDAHEAIAAAAILMTGLSRLATDLKSWNTMEFGMLELADEYSSVSSIMPQKKNPQALEYIKGAAAKVTGALTTALACSKNTALADVNDGVTALNVPVLEGVETSANSLAIMDGVLRTLTVRPARMRELAEIGFGTATELSDVIVRETGMSFRMAHNIVGKVVRETIEAGRTALDISADALERAARELFGKGLGIGDEVIRKALDPSENLNLRTITGGPAPRRIAEMIARRRDTLARDGATVNAVDGRIRCARERLDELVAALV
jgi:argininosuccinate lyase